MAQLMSVAPASKPVVANRPAAKPPFSCGDAVEFLVHPKAKSRTKATVQRMLDPTRVLVRYNRTHCRIVHVAALRKSAAPTSRPART